MRLGMMWRIMQIDEISITLHIMQKPNSIIIVLLFIQNIFKFLWWQEETFFKTLADSSVWIRIQTDATGFLQILLKK